MYIYINIYIYIYLCICILRIQPLLLSCAWECNYPSPSPHLPSSVPLSLHFFFPSFLPFPRPLLSSPLFFFLSDIRRRELVIGCAIHVCSASCFKYHSKGSSHICRHNFFHVATLCGDLPEEEVRLRRKGKPLRGVIGIYRETRYGMAGRILTYQMHPFECTTNYAALVAMRCNVDVQDLRRVLPPELWMPPEELEPEADPKAKAYTHGAYPQRFRDISVGPQDSWGWFRHLGTTEHYSHTAMAFTDWPAILAALQGKGDNDAEPARDDANTSRSSSQAASLAPPPDSEMSGTNRLFEAGNRAALAMFVDAHNTGYYINSYTTKLNPIMDTVLEKLVQCLHCSVQTDFCKFQPAGTACEKLARQLLSASTGLGDDANECLPF